MSKHNNQSASLELLFNSKARVKVLKFLFRNQSIVVGLKDLARRVQEPISLIKKEMSDLEKIGLVNKTKN